MLAKVENNELKKVGIKNLTCYYFDDIVIHRIKDFEFNPLSANPEKWSNTLKQIVGNLPTICLSVFDHFMNLALKGLTIFY